MIRCQNRFVYVLWLFLAAGFSLGWQSDAAGMNVSRLTENIGQKVEAMCVMEENNLLIRQDIDATSLIERQQNEQWDLQEGQRLQKFEDKIKIVQKKKEKKKKRLKNVPDSAKTHVSRKILWRIVEAEAGDQNVRGRRLVANVIINRVKSKEFPNTVKKVVFAPRQFSPIRNGSYYRVKVSKKTKRAVAQALRGIDDSQGALYFMWRAGADASNARWFDSALKKLFTYGCHEFFR